ncbi:hypothetical protein [Pseudomonas sp. GM_Psu_2]|uniref:hypothetical protein n=1 Tax=unclassified Pseudomonas TaxID=196821 RepID=UPI00226A509C|nr:hypothetical protein [Pseudomonas sp. GM_Psu_2]
MADLEFLPQQARLRWVALIEQMAVMGLGHLVRLYGQLEGYILALLDVGSITAPQHRHLAHLAGEWFVQCRAEFLKRKQKPRRRIAGAVRARIDDSQSRLEHA